MKGHVRAVKWWTARTAILVRPMRATMRWAVLPTVFNALPCNDGNLCLSGGNCSQGSCNGGAPVSCDDGNPCTEDLCDSATGCTYVAATGPCDDGSDCTVDDECIDSSCVGNSAEACDDGNPCTDDDCDELGGCIHSPNTAACDDGNDCTIGDLCVEGLCSSGSPDCDDSNTCTLDTCSPDVGCVFTPEDLACTDGDPCTENECDEGTCVVLATTDCDDANPCTDDSCTVTQGCVSVNNSAPCDDEEFCTSNDVCSGGACTGGPATDCDDGNICTNDSCDSLSGCIHEDETYLCEAPSGCAAVSCDPVEGCQFTADDSLCEVSEEAGPCYAAVCNLETGCEMVELAPCCGNGVVEADEECDDGDYDPGDGCNAQCLSEAQGVDCADINFTTPGQESGPFIIDPDGPGGTNPFMGYCDMERDGGGWTLVAVVADESDDNWTLNAKLGAPRTSLSVAPVHTRILAHQPSILRWHTTFCLPTFQVLCGLLITEFRRTISPSVHSWSPFLRILAGRDKMDSRCRPEPSPSAETSAPRTSFSMDLIRREPTCAEGRLHLRPPLEYSW